MSDRTTDIPSPTGEQQGGGAQSSGSTEAQSGSALGPGPANFTGNDMTGVVGGGDSGPDAIPGVVANPEEGITSGETPANTSTDGGKTTADLPGQGGTAFGPGTTGFGTGSGGAGGPAVTGGNENAG